MNRAQTGCLFAMRGKVAGQNDGTSVRMAGPEVVEKFLAEIGDRLGVENEEIGLRVDNNAMSLGDRRRDVHLGGGRRFVESGVNFLRHLQVWFQNENATAQGVLVSGMARRGVVHSENRRGGLRTPALTPRLRDRCLLSGKWKAVFVGAAVSSEFGDGLPSGRMKTQAPLAARGRAAAN